jgi:hypothetical protein
VWSFYGNPLVVTLIAIVQLQTNLIAHIAAQVYARGNSLKI